jgi:hypothetical protein
MFYAPLAQPIEPRATVLSGRQFLLVLLAGAGVIWFVRQQEKKG